MKKPKDTGNERLSLVKKQEKPETESNLEKDLDRARDAARAMLKELGVSACFMILMDERRDKALYSHAIWGENLHHLRRALNDAVQNYEAIELILDPNKKYRGTD
jgi:ATP-dependent Zn protease